MRWSGGALATSGDTRRHWRQGGIRRHHLLDPRTGPPAASDLPTVTVGAARSAQADVAATVAWLAGRAQAARLLPQWGLVGLLVERQPPAGAEGAVRGRVAWVGPRDRLLLAGPSGRRLTAAGPKGDQRDAVVGRIKLGCGASLGICGLRPPDAGPGAGIGAEFALAAADTLAAASQQRPS